MFFLFEPYTYPSSKQALFTGGNTAMSANKRQTQVLYVRNQYIISAYIFNKF